MKILVIENTPDEQVKARDAIEAAGHEALVTDDVAEAIDLIDVVGGVITDMFFNPFTGATSDHPRHGDYAHAEPPMGLCMVTLAMSLGKPVVICTDGDHHGNELAFVYDGLLTHLSRRAHKKAKAVLDAGGDWDYDYNAWCETSSPFGWIEEKDWGRAVTAIISRLPE